MVDVNPKECGGGGGVYDNLVPHTSEQRKNNTVVPRDGLRNFRGDMARVL